VAAGESVIYHATAEDAYGNTWDVTSETIFSIEAGAGGSWTDNTYTSQFAGDWTVWGEHDGLTDTALLHAIEGEIVSIALTPDEEMLIAGESVTYTVTAEDVHGNTWDVTDQTALAIEAEAGGFWADNAYTSEVAGDWTVTGEYDSLSDTAILHVEHGEATSIEIAPAEETVMAGESVTYTVTAEDAHGNTWDVTVQTALSIEAGAGGSWTDNVYTSETAGDWTVTGEYDALSDVAMLYVEPAPAAPEYKFYLPIVVNRRTPLAPDLVVEHVTVTDGGVQIIVENQGTRPVSPSEAFWVDLYVDPDPIPTGVNQTWDSLCDEGLVWGVTAPALPLVPGGTVTLTIGDEYYWPEHSDFSGSFHAGTQIVVQVDSANTDTTYGAVLESHEIAGGPYNNISDPAYVTRRVSMRRGDAGPSSRLTSSRYLPSRP
jgi:hypothetical protein